MVRWSRVSVLLLGVILAGFMIVRYSNDLMALSETPAAPRLEWGTFLQLDLSRSFGVLERRPGLTVLGDSYSVNNSYTWPASISERPMQILAYQGASVDKRYALKKTMSPDEVTKVADDLMQQTAKLKYISEEVVIWFGINDLMTIHFWSARERKAAILAEHATLFAVVDALIHAGTQHILIPLVIDFSQSPGCTLAREEKDGIPQDVTQDAINQWNSNILKEMETRPQVSTIDFYALSQEWFSNYQAYGLKYLINFDDPPELAFMWTDFLHMTPYVHQNLLAPQFEKALKSV